ncbi:hypothetical protein FVO59_04560 [Microbacterium esteraromaticum]|uniref:Uncharacterized protein n=1 Tax=Microbacterium esteraromaticum TaxID=57043 RepID=A0A7D8A7G8_9MICO|nr:hypothetical protein [Microbacterium esteraromaticum]QMU96560.1 hypothetical protein FVO59_04560 [Microbacterium esteraromaticum]
MLEEDRLSVQATNTHIYRGARLLTPLPAKDLASRPRGLQIVFSDGVEIPAELLQDDAGDFAIDVPEYRTAAGSTVTTRLWHVTIDAVEDASAIVVGTKV